MEILGWPKTSYEKTQMNFLANPISGLEESDIHRYQLHLDLNVNVTFRKKKKKTGENLQDLWLSKEFLDLRSKAQLFSIKEKIDKLDSNIF